MEKKNDNKKAALDVALLQIEMIQMGVFSAPGTFVLADDPEIPGLLKGQFTVTVSTFCTTEPDYVVEGSQAGEDGYSKKFFHLRSEATRNVGDLAGLTRAVVEADVEAFPFPNEEFTSVNFCY